MNYPNYRTYSTWPGTWYFAPGSNESSGRSAGGL